MNNDNHNAPIINNPDDLVQLTDIVVAKRRPAYTQTWFTFFMIFREEVKTSRIKLYSERSHRHSTKLVEVSLRFPPPTPAPARRWKDGTGLMNKILIKCAHVVCPNNVSLICINLLGLLTHVELSSVIDLQANNVCQTDSSGSGRCPPSSPSFFLFSKSKYKHQEQYTTMKKNEKMNNNNLLCDKQCYSSEAMISKIKNTITSSLACFLTIKMQSRVSLWKLCKTWKKLSYVNSHHNLITITFTLLLVLVWWYKSPYTVAELFGTFFEGDSCNKKTVNSPRVK